MSGAAAEEERCDGSPCSPATTRRSRTATRRMRTPSRPCTPLRVTSSSACLELGWSVAPVCVTRDPRRLLADLERARPDAAFHLAESVGGDARMEAAVAMLLEWIGMPYTGSPPQALTHALDKPVARALLAAHGVPVAAGVVLERGDESLAGLEPPWIVKPAREDASHGIHLESVVSDEAAARRLRPRVDRCVTASRRSSRSSSRAASSASRCSAQRGSRRRCRSSRSTSPDFRRAGRSSSPTPPSGTRRATSTGARRSIPARDLEPALARRVIETACAAYRALALRGYGRVDLRLAGDGRPDRGGRESQSRSRRPTRRSRAPPRARESATRR